MDEVEMLSSENNSDLNVFKMKEMVVDFRKRKQGKNHQVTVWFGNEILHCILCSAVWHLILYNHTSSTLLSSQPNTVFLVYDVPF